MEPAQEISTWSAGDTGRLQRCSTRIPELANIRNERGHSPVLIAQYHHNRTPSPSCWRRNRSSTCSTPAPSAPRPGRAAARPRCNADQRVLERRLLSARIGGVLRSSGYREAAPGARSGRLTGGAQSDARAAAPCRCCGALIRRRTDARRRRAPVNGKQEKGWTPLHEAVRQDNAEMTSYLLSHGADPKLQNDEGTSAIGLAAKEGRNRHVESCSRDSHESVRLVGWLATGVFFSCRTSPGRRRAAAGAGRPRRLWALYGG